MVIVSGGAQWAYHSDTVHSSPVHLQKLNFSALKDAPQDAVEMLEYEIYNGDVHAKCKNGYRMIHLYFINLSEKVAAGSTGFFDQ